jgi:hypothetical protein
MVFDHYDLRTTFNYRGYLTTYIILVDMVYIFSHILYKAKIGVNSDSEGANHKWAHLLCQSHPEVIVDQSDCNTEVIMIVALLLEGALRLSELFL